MADILIDNEALPATPASGKATVFVDSTTKRLTHVDDAGLIHGILNTRTATASQGAGFAADTYITSSGLQIPSSGLQIGMIARWEITLSKTAAGVAAIALQFRLGAAQSTGDTSLLTLTQAAAEAQSALVSAGIMIVTLGIRGPISASGVVAGAFGFTQTYQATAGNLALGGGIDGVSGSVTLSAQAGNYLGLSLNCGTSAAYTISSVQAQLIA